MTKRRLGLGISPCPNDTFLFDALVHGRVPSGYAWDLVMEDVEALNTRARGGELAVTKISYHAFFHVADRYALLRAGGALGHGCGPLLVTRDPGLGLADLPRARVAVPGLWTTAAMLLRLMEPGATDVVAMPFDAIAGALARGEADAGLLIHELRFTYEDLGLRKLADLGDWWEGETGCPIPLGAILARRDLGPEAIRAIDAEVRASAEAARADPDAALPFMAAHAQEMDPGVMRAHVDLYVNEFSLDLGDAGVAAVEELRRRGVAAGLFPEPPGPLFA